jgi:hypothetical protein
VFKKLLLGSVLVAGLTACPIVDPVDPQPASPVAKDDTVVLDHQTLD